MPCCFFGHHDAPDNIKEKIADQVKEEIKNGETEFLVGNHGHYDYMVLSVLRTMKEAHPHICYSVVLAYMPDASPDEYSYLRPEETVYPEGLESVPRKFAIVWRNDWMLRQSEYVITYITHTWGGAYQYSEKAKRQKKHIVNISSTE